MDAEEFKLWRKEDRRTRHRPTASTGYVTVSMVIQSFASFLLTYNFLEKKLFVVRAER